MVVLRAHVFGKGEGPPTKGFLKKFHCTVDFMKIQVMPTGIVRISGLLIQSFKIYYGTKMKYRL